MTAVLPSTSPQADRPNPYWVPDGVDEKEFQQLLRHVFLGGLAGVRAYRASPEAERHRDAFILELGTALMDDLGARGVKFFRHGEPPNELPEEEETRVHGVRVSLGAACIATLARGEYTIEALRREYNRILDEPKRIAQEINKKAYQRHWYAMKRAAARGRKEHRWNAEVRDLLVAHKNDEIAAAERGLARTDAIPLDEFVVNQLATRESLNQAFSQLSESEKATLQEILDETPTSGPASRQRRSRLRRKLRVLLEASGCMSHPPPA